MAKTKANKKKSGKKSTRRKKANRKKPIQRKKPTHPKVRSGISSARIHQGVAPAATQPDIEQEFRKNDDEYGGES
jgi:hypothetical protein